jgi:hypothetical protein
VFCFYECTEFILWPLLAGIAAYYICDALLARGLRRSNGARARGSRTKGGTGNVS